MEAPTLTIITPTTITSNNTQEEEDPTMVTSNPLQYFHIIMAMLEDSLMGMEDSMEAGTSMLHITSLLIYSNPLVESHSLLHQEWLLTSLEIMFILSANLINELIAKCLQILHYYLVSEIQTKMLNPSQNSSPLVSFFEKNLKIATKTRSMYQISICINYYRYY